MHFKVQPFFWEQLHRGTPPSGNTCLHIASIHGHEQFCKDVVALGDSLPLALFAKTNLDGETPLATAVRSGSVAVATVLLRCCQSIRDAHRELVRDLCVQIVARAGIGCDALHALRHTYEEILLEVRQAILKQDKDGCNVLHHAIHYGHRALALELIAAEPELSTHVNNYKESPMFSAAMRFY